jgi:hypothetical protein
MSFGEHGHITADVRKRRLRQHPAWRGCVDAVRLKHFAGQVKPMPPGVFGETAKDVGKLQRAAEFCCNAVSGWCPLSENTHRDPTDGHRHALAVAIELGVARRPDVGARVHFHTVDDGQKIRTLQAILADGFA